MQTEVKAKQVRVKNLAPGMELAKAVHSDGGSRLFEQDVKLTGSDIDRMKKWEVRYVYVKPGT